jgi:hypothetical protein
MAARSASIRIETLGAHVDAHQPAPRSAAEGRQAAGRLRILGVHEHRRFPLLGKQIRDAAGMVDVAGDHQAARLRMPLSHPLQPAPGLEQQALGDAAAIPGLNRPAQVAGPPALAALLRQGRGFSLAIARVAAMVDPAVLEAEFQRPHIPRLDELQRFDAEIRHDPLADAAPLLHPDPAGGAEGQGIGAEGSA